MPTKTGEEYIRKIVLTEWGKQEFPLVIAPAVEIGKHWFINVGDDFLTNQGSYARFIVTPASPHRLRGLRIDWAVIINASGVPWTERWSRLLQDLAPLRCSTWTERT